MHFFLSDLCTCLYCDINRYSNRNLNFTISFFFKKCWQISPFFFVKIYPVDANERIFKKIKLHCDLLPIKACPFENQQKCVLFYEDHNGPSILRFAVLIELDLMWNTINISLVRLNKIF